MRPLELRGTKQNRGDGEDGYTSCLEKMHDRV